jgi:plastocyanin
MVFEVRAVPRAEYDAWFQAKADAAAATPPPAASPGASDAPPAGETLTIEALNIQWTTGDLEVEADQPFNIRFRNQDAGVPHNVEIKDAGGQSVYMGEIFSGIAERTYQVPALPAGTYSYICTVHPNMTATLTAN